jgi:hypothetical protein
MLSALLILASLGGVPEGSRLRADAACYTIFSGKEGQEQVIGVTSQTIAGDRIGGRKVWRIVVHQRLAGGRFDMRDVFVLDARTLQPLTLQNSRNGKPHARLDYRPGRVTGSLWDQAGVPHSVDQPLSGPVWEGNLFGPTFAVLPLAAGARFEVPFYQYDKGLGTFTVFVKGRKIVQTPTGPVDAWVLDAGAGSDERLEYLIAKKSRRELGYRASEGSQQLGGDCSGLD